MRILVFSDSHGQPYYMRKVLLAHPEAELVIHLGDGEHDLDTMGFELQGRPVVKVRGNCDFGSSLNAVEMFEEKGCRLYCTHGYLEHVKYGYEILYENARGMKADIVLFGHTHEQFQTYEDGIYLLNPGAAYDGYYAMVDITEKGIMINLLKA